MEKYNETIVLGAQKGRSFGSRDAHEGNGVKRKHQRDDEGFSEMQPTYYITLAKESPRESIFESDDATYDSFHGRETDECRDTSDTDSDGTIAVLEYEVATDCSSSEDNLYSGDSSSGTEREVVIAAWMSDDSSSGSDFAIFADTEASDGSATDPELRTADYWECVKCKNKQNNPLYRYCEKCYLIRKNHFPPRPKCRKKRSKRKKSKARQREGVRDRRFRSTSTSDVEEATESRGNNDTKCHENDGVDGKGRTKDRKCNLSGRTYGANSAGETPGSGEDEELVVHEGPSKNARDTRTRVDSVSSEDGPKGREIISSSLGKRKMRSSRVSKDILGDEDEDDEENGAVGYKKGRFDRFENKFFKNVIEHLGQSEESGVQSCVSSSQEFSPTSSLTTILSSQMSQETFCDDLELERPKSANNWSDKSTKDVDERENLGLCIMCLEEPKNGVFVHSRFLHLCCCYKCAVKVWNKQKRCPICNSKVKNVLKLFVH